MTRLLLVTIMVALLAGGCGKATPDAPAAPPFTEEMGIDLLFKFESGHISKEEKMKLVTGREKQWLEAWFEDKAANRMVRYPKDWYAIGSVVKLEKATNKEAFMIVQYVSASTGQPVTIRVRFVPENGVWKIENHQNPNGTWWAPK